MGVLALPAASRSSGDRSVRRAPYPLAIGAIYWHLVDVIWIFLWPLFYLVPGNVR